MRFALIGFLVSVSFAGEAVAPMPRTLTPDGLPPVPASLIDRLARYNDSRSATLFDWDPSSHALLIGTRFADVPQIHRIAFPGGARQQLTFFPDRVTSAEYEPKSGSFFVFSKDSGGGEFYQFYRLESASGEVTLMTDGTSRNTGLRWSRDGKHIAFSTTHRNGHDTDIWVMDPRDPQSGRLLLECSGGGWQVEDWSPDGSKLLVRDFHSVNESVLYLVDSTIGKKDQLTREEASYSNARFTPDGASAWLITDLGGDFNRIALLDLKTGGIRFPIANTDHDVEDFDLTLDGRRLAYTLNREGVSELHVLDTNTHEELRLPEIPYGVIGSTKWNSRGDELALSLSSANSPSDIYSIDPATTKLERWTFSETGGLNQASLVTPRLVRWKSFDGRMISGFLYAPPEKFAGKRPVIINIHGGPEGQSRPGFLARNNYFINELGIAMIYPNVRGSSGYGKSFVNLDNGLKREDSVKDIGALLDWIAGQPGLDSSRVMVTGGSYGGYMTLASMVHYNSRIRCAVDVVGISNFSSFLARTQSYRRDLRRVEYGDERDPRIKAFFDEISPLSRSSTITKPMFIVAGRNDPRVPWQEGQQMTEAVRKNGAPVWLLIGENEGHGFSHKENQDYQFAATVQFVQQYLLK